MLVYAGIDEAGYGPVLGPLCIGMSAFVIHDHDPAAGAPDLWKLLQRAVCRRRKDARRRIAVDDSKNLKGAPSARTHPLQHLERATLGFFAAQDRCPDTDDELFAALLASVPDAPWYGTSTGLPVAQDRGQLRIAAARLRRAMDQAGVEFAALRGEAIDAGRFNALVDRLGSKASVNLGAAMRLVDQVWRSWDGHHPRVIVDRQGGRIHYRDDLQLAYPDARIRILAESEPISRYRLHRAGSTLTLSFVREAETHHFPVALASMVAKYVRELFMLRLNRFFQAHLPELKPTAGYFTDGRRFLEDVDAVVRRLRLARPELVRKA